MGSYGFKWKIVMILTKLFQFQHQIVSPTMFQNNCPVCRVCGVYCSRQEWDRSRSCTSCHNFYQRSTLAMNRYSLKRKKQWNNLLFNCLVVSDFLSDLDNYSSLFRSKHFSYHCTCIENCAAKGEVMCNWSSGKRNHCKRCRYVKYQST